MWIETSDSDVRLSNLNRKMLFFSQNKERRKFSTLACVIARYPSNDLGRRDKMWNQQTICCDETCMLHLAFLFFSGEDTNG